MSFHQTETGSHANMDLAFIVCRL